MSDGAGVRVSWGWSAQGEAEEAGGVVIADVFDHGTDKVFAVGQFTALDVATKKAAKNTTEIFVAGKRHERAGIRQHADETREQANV